MRTLFGWAMIAAVLWFWPTMFAVVRWQTWNSAITVERARVERPDLSDRINPAWRAVVISHGVASEWIYGTKDQNPKGYRERCWQSGLIVGLELAFMLSAWRTRKLYVDHGWPNKRPILGE